MAWGRYRSNRGLTFIKTVTASTASSSLLMEDIFSSTYDNYRLIINGKSTEGTATNMEFRLRVAGADSSANYACRYSYSSGTTWYAGSTGYTNIATLGGGSLDNNLESAITVDIFAPYLAQPTVWNFIYGSTNYSGVGGGRHSASTSYTGLNWYADLATGTRKFTGTISAYGYTKEA